MRARWKGSAAALALTLLLPLAGCGESQIDRYCHAVEGYRTELADMVDSSSATALLSHRPMLHDLASQAPEDLTDEWQTFLAAVDGLQEALDRAGVKASAFSGGKPPAGMSAAARKAVADAADQLRSDDVVLAANGIEQQGRDVCKVNFGL